MWKGRRWSVKGLKEKKGWLGHQSGYMCELAREENTGRVEQVCGLGSHARHEPDGRSFGSTAFCSRISPVGSARTWSALRAEPASLAHERYCTYKCMTCVRVRAVHAFVGVGGHTNLLIHSAHVWESHSCMGNSTHVLRCLLATCSLAENMVTLACAVWVPRILTDIAIMSPECAMLDMCTPRVPMPRQHLGHRIVPGFLGWVVLW